MTAAQNTPFKEPIYEASTQCLSIFDEYLQQKGDGSAGEDKGSHRFFLVVEELRASFKQWVAYTGAFAPVRASLDARLAFHTMTRDMVLEMIGLIKLNLCWAIPREHLEPTEDEDAPGLAAVKATMDRLFTLAVDIRRSARDSHRLRSDTSKNPDTSNEHDKPLLRLLRRKFPNAPRSLHAQLATSIHVRGTSLRYLQNHNSKLALGRHDAIVLSALAAIPEDASGDGDAGSDDIFARRPRGKGRQLEGTESLANTLHSTFSEGKMEQHRARRKPTFTVKSIGSTMGASQGEDVEYPSMPKTKGPCPVCADPIDPKIMDPSEWRRHINQDLEPYICISEQCLDPPRFFANSEDWMNHMNDRHTIDWANVIHTERWYCHICTDLEFEEREELADHLKDEHGDKLTPSRISASLRRNRRVAQREDIFACPLCSCVPEQIQDIVTQKPYRALSGHVAHHLKALAFHSFSYIDVDWAADSDSVDNFEDESLILVGHSQGSATEDHADGEFDEIPDTLVSSTDLRSITHQTVTKEWTETFEDSPPPLDQDEDWHYMPYQEFALDASALSSLNHVMHYDTLKDPAEHAPPKNGTMYLVPELTEHFTIRPESSNPSELGEMLFYVLCGPPGCGKTAQAIHYSQKMAQRGFDIIWVDASSRPALQQSVRSIGASLGVSDGVTEEVSALFETVSPILRSNKLIERRILVLDDFNDLEHNLEPSDWQMLRGELRLGEKHIIITTQSEPSTLFVGQHPTVLAHRIEPMDPDQALQLFEKLVPSAALHRESVEVMTLLKRLEYHPRAIYQASQHLQTNLVKYVLLHFDFKRVSRFKDHYYNTAYETVERKLDRYAEVNSQVKELLNVIASFPPEEEDIRLSVLIKQLSPGPWHSRQTLRFLRDRNLIAGFDDDQDKLLISRFNRSGIRQWSMIRQSSFYVVHAKEKDQF